jgi:AraC-like DNA-binding protein
VGDVIADWPRDRMLSLVSLGRRHGIGESVLLAGTRTGPTALSDPGGDSSVLDEQTVIRNLLAATDPALPLPLEAGLDFHLLAVGSWGQAIRTCPDFGTAIAYALGSAQSLPTSIDVDAQVSGDSLVLTMDDRGLPDDVRVFITVRNLIAMAMTARELLGRPLPLWAVHARSPELPYGAMLAEFCGVGVQWDAAATSVVTDVGWLQHPLAGADPDAHAAAVHDFQRMLERHRSRAGVAERVRLAVRRGAPTLGAVATSLGMSQRSLRRHLAAEGAPFRSLITEDRLGRAELLLAEGHSIDTVARRLGYSEPAAFSRAFKRWTGRSPDAWRRAD